MSAPIEHIRQGQKLEAEALIDLYEIRPLINNVVVRFTSAPTRRWRGNVYESIALRMTGDSRSAEDEESRPILQIMDPNGALTLYGFQGYFDKAKVKRLRVLRSHYENNVNIYDQRLWYVSRIRELLAGNSISLELRNMSDGPNITIPARVFAPPEFPSVSLS